MNVLTISGQPHPKARVLRVDSASGLIQFVWLDASENALTSGGCSIARFTPSSSVVNGVTVWAEPTEAELIAAIEAA